MNKKWLLSLSFAGMVAISAACGNADQATDDNSAEPETQEEGALGGEQANGGEGAHQAEMPEPDLEGIPDVVAEVNGEAITRDEFEETYTGQFQQMVMQAQMTGQEVNQDQLKEQLVERLIGQELLIQETAKSGFEASQEEIDELLTNLAVQNGMKSKEEFMTALQEQGMDEAEVISQLETQVKVDKLIASESGNIEPTEKELKEAYDTVVAQQKQMGEQGGEEVEVPPFDEVKSQLAKQLKNQKEAEAIQSLLGQLREEADVTVNL